MFDFKWLQMFAEGGEGGEGSAPAEATPTEGATPEPTGEQSQDAQLDSMMSRIPERAKGAFKEAYKATQKGAEATEAPKPEAVTHVPYADLIKTDEYKAEHKAWADKAFSERFKAKDAEIANLNQRNAKLTEALGRIAPKYGLDPNSENFIDEVSQKLESDDSFIEGYAMDHDMSVEEAKRNLELQNRVQRMEAEQRQREAAERNAQMTRALLANADFTKRQHPEFDLDTEWQNEAFRKEVFDHGMDTTVAYEIIHRKELQERAVAEVSKKTQVAIANSIKSGQNRPIEGGLSKTPAAVVRTTPNFDGMTAKQMAEYAQKNLRR